MGYIDIRRCFGSEYDDKRLEIMLKFEIKNGWVQVPDGVIIIRYEDGSPMAIESYQDIHWHGEQRYYDRLGNIISHEVYISGDYYCEYHELSEIDRFELALKYGVEWVNSAKLL